jgi:hypothetical protein
MLYTLHCDNERFIITGFVVSQLPRAISMLGALSVPEVRKINAAYFSYLNEPILSDVESRLSLNAVTFQ